LGESFFDRSVLLGIQRDTRNNENIPVDGSRLETGWTYHDVDDDHDFHEWTGRYTAYFKLGAGHYELTPAEEAARGGLSLENFIRNIEYQRLRRQIFERKVLVFSLYGAQSFELPGNRMPLYGTQSLGNATPLRAYPGSRYRNYAVAAASAEYRFPLLRIMDGLIFNEYGAFGPALTDLDPGSNLRNSWGFGVRVRRADMFLFRLEAAFHGLSGFTLNASSDTPF
jgi:outer membrane protein assembly factor BamA